MIPLAVKSLRKSFGAFNAVDGLSFHVETGDIYGFLGPNGAGKSTTIRMLLGLIRPDEGDIRLFGKSLLQHRAECMSRIGAIVEKPDFYKYLSAYDNLKIFGTMSGADTSSVSLEKMLELVGLTGRGKDPVKNYSHGMKQRLGLAQALLHNPSLIILDEPTTGLDPQGIIDLRELILQLSHQGKTVFMSSHILSEIELIATRMVIISKGKAVAEGSVQELLNADDLVVDWFFPDGQEARSLFDQSEWKERIINSNSSAITLRLNEQEVQTVNNWLCQQGVSPVSINSRRKLEDYFMKLTH